MGDLYSLENLDPRCTDNLLPVSIIGSVGYVLWAVAYVVWVVKAFRDRAPALPMVAICINFSWEFLDVFAFPNPNPAFVNIGRSWLLIDVVLVWQLLRYGPALQTIPLRRRLYRPTVGLVLLLGLVGQYTFVAMYRDVIGIVLSYIGNLIMSILFIQMLLARQAQGHRRGISVAGGWLKMLGTLCASIHGHFLVQWCNPALPNVWFVDFLCASIFLSDCVYVALLYLPPERLRALVEPAPPLPADVARS